MGSQQFVYGYIEVDSEKSTENLAVLTSWQFDELFPFTNIFHPPRRGYQSSVIAFAGASKDLSDEWDCWIDQFEALLRHLFARSAVVKLEDEHDGLIASLSYLCEEGWTDKVEPQQRTWRKWDRFKEDVGSPSRELPFPRAGFSLSRH